MLTRLRLHARQMVLAAGLALLALPLAAAAQELVPGVDYLEIPGGAPFSTQDGKVEVVEVFGYTCPHCASFEPHLVAWERTLPDDVALVRVPAPFGGQWMPYARAYYAAEAQGIADRTHQAVFDAIHGEGTLLASGVTDAQLADFYAARGADRARFLADLSSEETRAKLREATGFLQRSRVEGTPSLVVNGRYRVLGRTIDDILRNTTALIERERRAAR